MQVGTARDKATPVRTGRRHICLELVNAVQLRWAQKAEAGAGPPWAVKLEGDMSGE